MTRSEVAYIALTMMVSAALTLAVEFWPARRPNQPLPVSAAPVIPAPGAKAAAAEPVHLAEQTLPAASAAVQTERNPSNAAPAADAGFPGAGQPAESLPVAFHIRNRRDIHQIDGVITNISNQTLAITLRAIRSGTQTTSEISFQLAPGERKNYSTDDGLDMQSNDQLLVLSPPYQERVVQVP